MNSVKILVGLIEGGVVFGFVFGRFLFYINTNLFLQISSRSS